MTKGSFAFAHIRSYISIMRIVLIILMLVSLGFTRAAVAMPALMTDLPAMAMDMSAPLHHDMRMGQTEKAPAPQSRIGLSHCICVMCFPALAATGEKLRTVETALYPLPESSHSLVAGKPEPVSPPPRQA